jgi:NAD(P)-dependent dehydrogenase (short-subunit alcohol dehydrogenase family)
LPGGARHRTRDLSARRARYNPVLAIANARIMQKKAVITGANRGIGLAVARRLAQQGLVVLLACRDRAAGLAAAGEHPELAGCEIIGLDLADPENTREVASGLADRRIDVLVNNAGVLARGDGLAFTMPTIETAVRVNALGPLQLALVLGRAMAEQAYGRIVNVSSGWGSFAEGLGGPLPYAISKATLNAVTVKLAQELPATVKVNACCPGWVRTRMGGAEADRSVEEGADTVAWLATLDDDGPTGGFFRDRRPIEW